jgi:hypothetical protein
MGFLKKITRPISRVLDKIVPNEIKPALPFLAAAAPFLAPGIMGAFGGSMLSRGLISGGLNLGSQLAQEGSEGDFSALSLAMASGIGALSTPGGTDFSMSAPGEGPMTTPSAADFFKNKAAGMEPGFAKSGLGALEGTSNYLTGVGETLRTNPFSMEGLKAATVPVGQGITDLAVAENRRAMKDYERDMADYDAEQGAANAQRAAAIRQSMEAYGFTDDEIEDAIYAAGYKTGGRVGFEFGGITDAVEAVEETPKEFLVDKLKVTVQPGQSEEMGILNAMFNDTDGVMSDERKMEFYKLYIPQLYRKGEISEEVYEGMKEDIFGEGKAEGGIMDLGGKEMDLRGGGFVPIGKKERADDVPARLSKNEFVMTADAVRAAGGGSVNEGAKRMYETMNRLEAKV